MILYENINENADDADEQVFPIHQEIALFRHGQLPDG